MRRNVTGSNPACQAAAQGAARQGAHRHHQHRRPDHLPRKQEKDGGGKVDAERQDLLQGVQAGQGVFQNESQHGQDDDAEPGAEVAAVDGGQTYRQNGPGLVGVPRAVAVRPAARARSAAGPGRPASRWPAGSSKAPWPERRARRCSGARCRRRSRPGPRPAPAATTGAHARAGRATGPRSPRGNPGRGPPYW